MENGQHSDHSEDEAQRGGSPLPNSQESEISIVEVQESAQTDGHTTSEDIMANTQAILEIPTSQKKKTLAKNKGIGKSSVAKQRKQIQTMSFFIWLKNYWDSDSTMLIMPKFLTALKEYALKHEMASLGRLVRPLSQIMKTFILDMQKQKHNLKKISWDSFESWALNQGLSMMYSNGPAMVWENGFEETLYKIYAQTFVQWQDHQQNQSTDEEEESSLCPNTITTSILSTIARTGVEAAAVDSCGSFKNTAQKRKRTVSFHPNPGHKLTSNLTSKSKMNVTKSTSDSAKRRRKMSTSDEESDLELPPVTPKKVKVPVREDSESEVSECDNLNDMLDAAVRAQCLLRTPGDISQSISLKHQDNLVTLKSRGERGTKVIKLEIYPYNDCLKRDKQEWWKYAEMRSLFLSYSDDSHVGKLVEKLTAAIFKQVQETKKLEIKTAAFKPTWKTS